MHTTEDFEEIEIDEYQQKPVIHFQKTKHIKYFSGTFSTNSCTIDLEKTKTQTTSKVFTEVDPKILRGHKYYSPDFPERLLSFKQIVDNKKKFLKIEQDLKELEECTFKPRTNLEPGKSSLSQIRKKQLEYTKNKNSASIRAKLANTPKVVNRVPKAEVERNGKVYERLYRDSKIFLRGNSKKKAN